MAQDLILQTLKSQDAGDRIINMVATTDFENRSVLGRKVCELFGFHDAHGRLHIAGYLKALRGLEAEGVATLPAPQVMLVDHTPVQTGPPPPLRVGVPASPRELGPVDLVPVRRRLAHGQPDRAVSASAGDHHPCRTALCELRYLRLRLLATVAGGDPVTLLGGADCRTSGRRGGGVVGAAHQPWNGS